MKRTHHNTAMLNLTDDETTNQLYELGFYVNLRQLPPKNVSLYYSTGNTEDPDWHIGSFTSNRTVHHQIFTRDTMREGYHPTTKTNSLSIQARDTYTNEPIYKSTLGPMTAINLNTQFTYL